MAGVQACLDDISVAHNEAPIRALHFRLSVARGRTGDDANDEDERGGLELHLSDSAGSAVECA